MKIEELFFKVCSEPTGHMYDMLSKVLKVQQSPNFWWFLAYLSAFHHLQCFSNVFSWESTNFQKETLSKAHPNSRILRFCRTDFLCYSKLWTNSITSSCGTKTTFCWKTVQCRCQTVPNLSTALKLSLTPSLTSFSAAKALFFFERTTNCATRPSIWQRK